MGGFTFRGAHWSDGLNPMQQRRLEMACSIMRKLESFQAPKRKRK